MQNETDGLTATQRVLDGLAAGAVVGALLSGFVMATVWPEAFGKTVTETDIVDQGLHNLTAEDCRSTLDTLLNKLHNDPRALWVWVEESVPTGSSLAVMTQGTTVMREAPRPYAFRPDAASIPAGACAFGKNSLHALTLGGIAGAVLDPDSDPLRLGVGI